MDHVLSPRELAELLRKTGAKVGPEVHLFALSAARYPPVRGGPLCPPRKTVTLPNRYGLAVLGVHEGPALVTTVMAGWRRR